MAIDTRESDDRGLQSPASRVKPARAATGGPKRSTSARASRGRPTPLSVTRAPIPGALPYMNASGRIAGILNKIREARTPDHFTQDYLSTVLGASGGSAMPFISLAKRIGFLAADGTPTDTYKSFRNSEQSGTAMLAGLRIGYKPVYERNEFAHKLPRNKLEGIVTEITGLEKGAPVVRAIVGTFEALRSFVTDDAVDTRVIADVDAPDPHASHTGRRGNGLNLAYSIQLNLPPTSDIAVFNAIFRSLRDNLLD